MMPGCQGATGARTIDHVPLLVEPALGRVVASLQHHVVALQPAGEVIPGRSYHGILTLEVLDHNVLLRLQNTGVLVFHAHSCSHFAAEAPNGTNLADTANAFLQSKEIGGRRDFLIAKPSRPNDEPPRKHDKRTKRRTGFRGILANLALRTFISPSAPPARRAFMVFSSSWRCCSDCSYCCGVYASARLPYSSKFDRERRGAQRVAIPNQPAQPLDLGFGGGTTD